VATAPVRDPLHWLDVKRKLALTFVGVCLLAFGVGGSLAATSASTALEEEIVLRLRYQCRAWADALDADLALVTRRAEDFASDGYIRECAEEALADVRGPARDALQRHLAANKLPLVAAFADLVVLDDAGAAVATASGAEPPLLGDVAAAAARGAGERPWHSGLLASPAAGGAPFQAVAVPLRSLDGRRRLGHLVAFVRTERWIGQSLRRIEGGDARRDESVDLVLADAAGREVRVPPVATGRGPGAVDALVLPAPADAVAPSPVSTDPLRDGTISESVPLATNGWTARVSLTAPGALAPVSGLQVRFLLVGAALAAAIGVILLFPMRFLARPLVELREAARRLEGGDLAVRVAADTEDEIGDLSRSFNHMADAVETRTRRLEDAARELASQRDRLDAVIASMRDGLVVLDPDGTPVLSNASAKPLLDLVAANDPRITSHYGCDDPGPEPRSCASCLLSPRRPHRACVIDADGRTFEVHTAPMPPAPDGRRGRVLTARDVTDRIAHDEHEIHEERLSVLGEVAAVMAHELNNPLAAISMFSQMTADGLGPDSPYREHLDVIRRNTETCKRTIRELLDWAAGSSPEIGEVDLHALLEDVARFLRPVSERSSARVVPVLGAHHPALSGDEIQLRQVFVNLVVNALQSMGKDGGEVRLETRDDGDHVVVDVVDSGPGVPPSARARVFEPFFTTKKRGMGTGLGLPTARRIAELHGGGLDLVETGPGRTVFRVRLRCTVPQGAVA
jgi:signal transduction histidine kinase